jgi:tRNA A-37 threonylcarbamoyl transferase component Bud32
MVAAAFPQLQIVELIGQGGMGVVFKARQPKLERFVALKILPQKLAEDAAFAERFSREGRVLARLSHPNIVGVHDFGQANGFFYLLMEFVDGVNLRQAMKAGRFTPEQALAVVPKICEALQYAHNEGVLHRDIKPENILLDAKGRVKIADFGIAKLIGEPHADRDLPGSATHAEVPLTGSGAAIGTPHYMAPEQIEHPSAVDHRADIYSLGVVFYEMLTGELPLGRFAPPSEKSTADPRLDDVVLRALAKEPGRRTQSAGEVKTQVETICSSETAPSPIERLGWKKILAAAALPVGAGIVLDRWVRGFHVPELAWWPLIDVLLVVAFVAWLGTFIWRKWRRPEPPAQIPAWIDRAGWLFVLYGLLPAGWSLGTWITEQRLSVDLRWLVALTGIALWTRSPRWRKAALISNGVVVTVMVSGIITMLTMTLTGMIPEDYPTPQHKLTTFMLQSIGSVFGFAASFWVLNRTDVRMLFRTGQWQRSSDEPKALRFSTRVSWLKAGLAVLLFVVLLGGILVVPNLIERKTPVTLPQPTGQFPKAPTGKMVELTRVERVGDDAQTISAGCESEILPGETLFAFLRYADGRIEDAMTTVTISHRTTGTRSHTSFIWRFPDSVEADQSEAATMQLRKTIENRPLSLTPSVPLALFAVTNTAGAVVEGVLEFKRFLPSEEDQARGGVRAQGTLRLTQVTNLVHGLRVVVSLNEPAGWALQATVRGSDEGRADTSIHRSAHWNHRNFLWFLPSAYTPEEIETGLGQLQKLREQGPINIVAGEPQLLFSITNRSGEVYQGFAELVRPPNLTPP